MTNSKILKNPLIKKALNNFIEQPSSRYVLRNQIGTQIINQIQTYLQKKVDKLERK